MVKATLSEFIKKERCHHFLMLKREEVPVRATAQQTGIAATASGEMFLLKLSKFFIISRDSELISCNTPASFLKYIFCK